MSLSVLPVLASRTAGPNKSSHVKIIEAPISPGVVGKKDLTIYSLYFWRGVALEVSFSAVEQ